MINKSLCVFDLDGTLDLKGTDLFTQIAMLYKKGMQFVVATGRTNKYVIDVCSQNNIIPPKFIIADNGGTIFDNRTGEYLKKTNLSSETKRRIMEHYLQIGGKLEEVRCTDGEKVYAAESEDVRLYYEKEGIIEYKSEDELLDAILNGKEDITKITLAGNKKIIQDIRKFIRNNGIKCWSDVGTTKFPVKRRGNYRLDIMDEASSKGDGLQFLIDYTGIDNFICIGNGFNDLSMFKLAIDYNMPIIVVRNLEEGKPSKESEELITQIQDYISQTKDKYAEQVNLITIKEFPVNSCLGDLKSLESLNNAKQRRQKFAKRINYRIQPQVKAHTNINHRVQERGR